ncbi:MAG: hypothetical protein ABL970_08910 [Nitrospira sp.]
MALALFGTKAQLAELLGLSERRCSDLVTASVLPPRTAKGFNLVSSVHGYVAFLKSGPSSLKDERIRLTAAKAGQEELKLRSMRGELVLKESVYKETRKIGRAIRDGLENLPSRLAGPFAGESNQHKIFEMLGKEIRQTLEVLSDERPIA